MIKPSSEVLAVGRRWLDAIVGRDRSTIKNLLSKSEHLRFIGTATDEFHAGSEVRESLADYFSAIPAGTWHEETFGEAFEAGSVGWVNFNHHVWIGHAATDFTEVRSTLILTLEGGSWKIVLRHGSVPANTIEAFQMEQTGISALMEAAREKFEHNQRQGMASVMFTDIVGSSTLASALGDRVWTPIITAHFAMIRSHVDVHGGQFVKSLGDGTMSSFPSARSALAAARDIQTALAADQNEPRLGVRIGLHTGDVVQSDDDFFGTVVNTAARITGAAGAGEVCVSDVTRMMVGTDFAFSDGDMHTLKGIDGQHTLYRLMWQP